MLPTVEEYLSLPDKYEELESNSSSERRSELSFSKEALRKDQN